MWRCIPCSEWQDLKANETSESTIGVVNSLKDDLSGKLRCDCAQLAVQQLDYQCGDLHKLLVGYWEL